MRNPRRDAIEYGVLLTLGTTAVVANGFLIYFRRYGGLEKIDLTAPVSQPEGIPTRRRPWDQSSSTAQSTSPTQR